MADVNVLERSPKGSRGPHAERTAAMRERLITAAVACLNDLGYAATTTQMVTDTAKVSRGAMLHHFPTKVDLMIAVAEYAAKSQNRYVAQRLTDVPEGMERYLAITIATWEAVSKPPAVALLEIMIASRSDPALSERLPAVIDRLASGQRKNVWAMAEQLGIKDRDAVEAMSRLHICAMRGMQIERMMFGGADLDDCVHLLERYKRYITGALVTEV